MLNLNESLFSKIETDEVTDNIDEQVFYQLVDSFMIDEDEIEPEVIVRYIVSLYNKLYFMTGNAEPCIYITRKYDYAHKNYDKTTMYDNYDAFNIRTINKELQEKTPDGTTPMTLMFSVKFKIVPDENYDYDQFLKDMYKIYRMHFINSDFQDMYFHKLSFLSDEDSFNLWPASNGKMIFNETPLKKMHSIIYKSDTSNKYTPTEFHSRFASKPNRGNITSIAIRLGRMRFKEFDLNFILSNTKKREIKPDDSSEEINLIYKNIFMECNKQPNMPYESGRMIDFIYQAFISSIKKNDIKAERHKNTDYLVVNTFIRTEPGLTETLSDFADNNDPFFGTFEMQVNGEKFTANVILVDERNNQLSQITPSKYGVEFECEKSLFD